MENILATLFPTFGRAESVSASTNEKPSCKTCQSHTIQGTLIGDRHNIKNIVFICLPVNSCLPRPLVKRVLNGNFHLHLLPSN